MRSIVPAPAPPTVKPRRPSGPVTIAESPKLKAPPSGKYVTANTYDVLIVNVMLV